MREMLGAVIAADDIVHVNAVEADRSLAIVAGLNAYGDLEGEWRLLRCAAELG